MRHGFSLVELSIVLVILGLLTGGILAGQSLIRAAELRSVVSEYQRYAVATRSFQEKYRALPGDMPNATAFWGAAHATPSTCETTAGTGTQTCNGDGDGLIGHASILPLERWRFWTHLANAGMIEGNYSGLAGPLAPKDSAIGVNVPRSKLSNAGWTMRYSAALTVGTAYSFKGEYGNIFDFGTESVNDSTHNTVLRPDEAWNIDSKLDDGRPAYGKVVAHSLSTCTTVTDGNDLTANYLLNSSDIVCALTLRNAF